MNYSTLAYPVLASVIILFLLGAFNDPLYDLAYSRGWIYEPGAINQSEVITPVPTPFMIEPSPVPVIIQTPKPSAWTREATRDLGSPFGWRRKDVSGTKDLNVTTLPYRYRFYDNLTIWSISWGQWFPWDPAPGNKFLIVWYNMVMNGEDPSWDPRLYGFKNAWGIQYKGLVITRDPDIKPEYTLKELETTHDLNDVEITQPWGWSHGLEQFYLRMGISNCWDGYEVYQVPKSVAAENLTILGNFEGFGTAAWRLSI